MYRSLTALPPVTPAQSLVQDLPVPRVHTPSPVSCILYAHGVSYRERCVHVLGARLAVAEALAALVQLGGASPLPLTVLQWPTIGKLASVCTGI